MRKSIIIADIGHDPEAWKYSVYLDGERMEYIDCEIKSAQFVTARGSVIIVRGCTYEAIGTKSYMIDGGTEGGMGIFDGNDFSAWGGSYILDWSQNPRQITNVQFTNNRIPSGLTAISKQLPSYQTHGGIHKYHGNGNADEYYQIYEEAIAGSIEEDTAIDRTGGATYDGTNLFSVKLTGNANTSTIQPLRFKLKTLLNSIGSGKTLIFFCSIRTPVLDAIVISAIPHAKPPSVGS